MIEELTKSVELTEEQAKMIAEMLKRAEENDVRPSEYLCRIAKARVRMHKDITVCPCAPNDTDRGCISAKCLREIQETGTCHCNAFLRKEKA